MNYKNIIVRTLAYILLLNYEDNLIAILWKSNEVESIASPKQHAQRFSSKPYISGDSYRSICDHICDETDFPFNPSSVKYGDTVYTSMYMASEFFELMHPKINSPYIIVTHHSDSSCPGSLIDKLEDPKLLMWFGINCDLSVSHPKFIPIPIGLANRYWNHGKIETVQKVQSSLSKMYKKRLVCINFVKWTNDTHRWPAFNFFNNKSYSATFIDKTDKNRQPYETYLTNMAESKFVVSPHGNGLDCHRTWEALLVGSFPIVTSSTLDPLYQGLPVLILKEWSEGTEEFLNQQYEIMLKKSYDVEKIYFKYWQDLIKNTQSKYRKSGNAKNKRNV
ncbi:MAG TPA: hypothetical protein VJJ81_02400 [Candidatus Babeliales bacterium]|nr:hypothetical protein [Candidatus Babeliales bacterium]